MLVATLSHFLELKTELELLGSRHSVDLIEDQADALWSLVSAALNSSALLIPSTVTCDSPDRMGE
jgi:hypothetical protein